MVDEFDPTSLISDEGPKSFAPWEVPRPKPIEDRSLLAATFKRETALGATITNAIESSNRNEFSLEAAEKYNFYDKVPADLREFADRFALDTTDEQMEETANILRGELEDKAYMAQYPWKSFFVGSLSQLSDPPNWIPGTAVFKNAKNGAKALSAAGNAAVAGVQAAVIQEAFISPQQATRSLQESAWNVMATGVLSSVLGGATSGLSGNLTQKVHKDIMEVLTDKHLEFKENGLPTDTRIANMSPFTQKAFKTSAKNRLLTSDLDTARQTAQALYENPLITQGNLAGEASIQGVELQNSFDLRQIALMNTDIQNKFLESRGINPNLPFAEINAKLFGEGKTIEEINPLVNHQLITEIKSTDPTVNAIASGYEKIRDKITKGLVETGLLSKDHKLENAEGHFATMYNKQMITERGGRTGEFRDVLEGHFTDTNNAVRSYRNSEYVKSREATIKELQRAKKKEKILAKEKQRLTAEIKTLKEEIVAGAPRALKDSSLKLRKVLSKEEVRASAQRTVDTILGDKDGLHMPGPFKRMTDGTEALRAREIMIPQELMTDWHIQDTAKVMDANARVMVPLINMTKMAQRMGHESIGAWRKSIDEKLLAEFSAKSEGLRDKKAIKASKEFKKAKKDIEDSFKLVSHEPLSTMNATAAEYLRNIRSWNFVRLLGMMTLASVADVGMHIFKNGPVRFIFNGLAPALQHIAAKGAMTSDEAKALGFGVETILGSRVRSMIDTDGLANNPNVFSRSLDYATTKFGNATLMNQWNDFMQSIASNLSIHRTLSSIHSTVDGEKLSKHDRIRLAQLGIDESNFKIIAEKTNGFVDEATGTRYSDWTNWEITTPKEAEALKQFQLAVFQDVNATVLVPGLGDIPTFAHSPIGKTLIQFKSFMFAANNKILASAIQRKDDMGMYAGITSMLGLGAMSYVLTSIAKGNEPDLSFDNLAFEAVDRSGVLGVFMESYNIAEKVGLAPGLGVSRYQSRGIAGALSGPTFGALEDVVSVLTRIKRASGEDGKPFNTKDAQKLLRLMPFQNLFYLYRLNRAVTNKAALGLGFEDAE